VYKQSIDEDIEKQRSQLNALKKSSKGVSFNDEAKGSSAGDDVDIDDMLEKLRAKILEIMINVPDSNGNL